MGKRSRFKERKRGSHEALKLPSIAVAEIESYPWAITQTTTNERCASRPQVADLGATFEGVTSLEPLGSELADQSRLAQTKEISWPSP